jgi:rhomboid protease GluP
MAHCVKCGRELSSVRFGAAQDTCGHCWQQTVMGAAAGGRFSRPGLENNLTGDGMPPLNGGLSSTGAPEFKDAPIRGGEVLTDPGRAAGDVGPFRARPVVPRVMPRPVVTIALVGICVLVFVLMVVTGVSPTAPRLIQLVHWGADYGPLTVRGQWWRLLTSAFVHIGFLHIVFNMWCLWNLGALAELVFGRAKFLAIYLVCAVISAIASLMWHPNVVSAGASGAIFGVAGALLAVFYLRKVPLPPAALKPTLRSLLTFAVFNLAFGSVVPGIDNAAHLGGLISGALIGALLPKREALG